MAVQSASRAPSESARRLEALARAPASNAALHRHVGHGPVRLARVLAATASVTGLAGAALGVLTLCVGLFDGATRSALRLLGPASVAGAGAAGGLLALLALLALLGVGARSPRLLAAYVALQLLGLAAQLAAAGLPTYYAAVVAAAPLDLDGGGRFSGFPLAPVLATVDGLTCRTYQRCCRDPALDRIGPNATCTEELDPSHPGFCPQLTGGSGRVAPPAAVCDALDWLLPQHDRAACQAVFCSAGADGYSVFVRGLVGWLQLRAVPVASAAAAVLVLQLVATLNACGLRRRYLRDPAAPRRRGPLRV